ncbi:mechanosensitive ion channel family protein [Cyanobium sp. NIES-981]|uniref:mechanosensitive ion channel family protein n=1 Tax=Cyanobium sp. NIES-981 TaxID=1851505 RepID=UPI0007DDA2CF|nr:mechanosensitive ion channel domain-containing protein [Cyanobium sp. NIES-981]SBO41799.1 Mechanosensitive ion channel family protein [Cyanobium sp. NIES-981]
MRLRDRFRRPAWLGRLGLGLAALAAVLVMGLATPAQSFILLDQKEVPEGCAAEPAAIRLDGQKVLEVRSTAGAESVTTVAERGSRTLLQLAQNLTIAPGDIGVKHLDSESFIVLQQQGEPVRRLGVMNKRIARCYGMEPRRLAELSRDQIRAAMVRYREAHSLQSWLRGSALAALVLAVYVVWLRLQFRLNGRIRHLIASRERFLLQQLARFGLSALLEPAQVRRLLQGVRSTVHWAVLLLISYLLVPLLLGFFPPTQGIASGLRQQLRTVTLGLLNGVVAAIPNLLTIAVIIGLGVLVVRASNGVFDALRLGRLRIPGFYREWARPTSRLVALLIAVATLVIAFPYIPGSGSKAFQGAGLFVGVFAALGSSAVAANIISGLMLIYTRAFREGDFVELNGVLGTVQDRTLLVTRVQTPHNQLVSIPNATVISNAVANYSFSRREIRQPVALACTITIGYDVPWRQVEALMLAAARSVEGVTDEMEPFVLQTALNDFHISYELTAFLRDANTYRLSLSQLHAALQDKFAEADVEILSPGYHAVRNGNPSTVPKTSSPAAEV